MVLYHAEQNRLFLVEAVTSHGPVTPKRVEELEVTLKDCIATRLYVSVFPDFRQLKPHVDKTASRDRGLGRGDSIPLDPFQQG